MSTCQPAYSPTAEPALPRGGSPTDEPLNAEHYRQLRDAEHRAVRIRKAAGIARFNGWMTAVAAASSAPFALFSVSGLVITIALSVIAYNEFRGRRLLLMFDPQSTRLLGWNQVAFMVFIVLYCAATGYSQWHGDSLLAQLGSQAELEAALGSLEGLEQLQRTLILTIYGTLAVVGVVFQGGNAIYYFTRRRLLDRFVRETPVWVLRILATQSGAARQAV